MAKVNLNQLLEMLHGKLGNLVFRRRPDGTVIASGKPRYRGKRKHKGTPAQKAHRQHVREIGPYASALAKIHPIYAELAAEDIARGKWMSPYNFAFADCLKPPVIHCIERQEGCIRVEATHNVRVEKVYVTVKDENEAVLDRGMPSAPRGTGGSFPPVRKEQRSWRRPGIFPGIWPNLYCSRDDRRKDPTPPEQTYIKTVKN